MWRLISDLMRLSKHTINISVAVVAVIALALTAALLPLGNSKEVLNQEGLLILEYPSRGVTGTTGQLGELDFRFFKLKPAEVARVERDATARSGITFRKIRRVFFGRSTAEAPATTSFVLVIDDTVKESYAAVVEVIQKQFVVRTTALRQSDPQGCAAIANAKSASNCRSEVIFQQAVLESNAQSCAEIENAELKARCQKVLG